MLFLLAPLITSVATTLYHKLSLLWENFFRGKYVSIEFEGDPGSPGSQYSKTPEMYSLAFQAISHYATARCLCGSLNEPKPEENWKDPKYVLGNGPEVDLQNGIFLRTRKNIPPQRPGDIMGGTGTTFTLILSSKTNVSASIALTTAKRTRTSFTILFTKDHQCDSLLPSFRILTETMVSISKRLTTCSMNILPGSKRTWIFLRILSTIVTTV